jgi:hypothetical protein
MSLESPMPDTTSAHELDLAIPDMDSRQAEERVRGILTDLPGIESVRLIERGAYIRHRSAITPRQICEAIRNGGYRASIFQDDAGHLGRSSQ